MGVGKWAKARAEASLPGRMVKGIGTAASFAASRGVERDVLASGPDVLKIKGGQQKAEKNPLEGAVAMLVGVCHQAHKTPGYKPGKNYKIAGKPVIRGDGGKKLLIGARKAQELEALAAALKHFGVTYTGPELREKSFFLVVDIAASSQLHQKIR
jgi:hypothetical protein